jgi:DNA-binding NarL/FixJ family response regulator
VLEVIMGAAQSANQKLATADAGMHRELAEIWRDISADPDIRILVISALADKATAIDALEKGASGFLCKPFTDRQLNEALRKLIEY